VNGKPVEVTELLTCWKMAKGRQNHTSERILDSLFIIVVQYWVIHAYSIIMAIFHIFHVSWLQSWFSSFVAWTCVPCLDWKIWHSCITLETKLQHHLAFILRVVLYGGETWSTDNSLGTLMRSISDVCILWVPWWVYIFSEFRGGSAIHISNEESRWRIQWPPLTSIIHIIHL